MRLIIMMAMVVVATSIRDFYDWYIRNPTDFDRVLVSIETDGTIVMTLYNHQLDPADNLFWLIPIPKEIIPSLKISYTDSFEDISYYDISTEMQVAYPEVYCESLLMPMDSGSGGGCCYDRPSLLRYDIIQDDNLRGVVAQLENYGYVTRPHMIPLIQNHIQNDMAFVLLKFDIGTTIIGSLTMSYQSENIFLPLSFSKQPEQRAIDIWIFGDKRYIPQYYAQPELDYSQMRALSRMYTVSTDYPDDAIDAYYYMLRQLQTQYRGIAITQFAKSSQVIKQWALSYYENSVHTPDLEWTNRYSYVTRVHVRFDEKDAHDEWFIPAPDAPDVDNTVNLNGIVDPLHFWGCSTREINNQRSTYNLERIIIDDVPVIYPKGWGRYDFIGLNQTPFIIFSPQRITSADLEAFFRDEVTPPMLLYVHPDKFDWLFDYVYRHDYWGSIASNLNLLLPFVIDIEAFSEKFDMRNQHPQAIHMIMSNSLYHSVTLEDNGWRGVYLLFTTDDDVIQNSSLYGQLWDAIDNDYSYYASPYLKNSLFLRYLYFAFPDGWVERMMPDDVVVIAPENTPITFQTPAIRLIPFENVGLVPPPKMYYVPYEMTMYYLRSRYQLDDVSLYRIAHNLIYDMRHACSTHYNTFFYEAGGYKGYISFSDNYGEIDVILEASAPSYLFDQYADILRWSADSFLTVNDGCG